MHCGEKKGGGGVVLHANNRPPRSLFGVLRLVCITLIELSSTPDLLLILAEEEDQRRSEREGRE